MNGSVHRFQSVWFVDFEFHVSTGSQPQPLCVVTEELYTRVVVRRWLEGATQTEPPYPTDGNSLFVAFFASAEIGCHLVLGGHAPHESWTCMWSFGT